MKLFLFSCHSPGSPLVTCYLLPHIGVSYCSRFLEYKNKGRAFSTFWWAHPHSNFIVLITSNTDLVFLHYCLLKDDKYLVKNWNVSFSREIKIVSFCSILILILAIVIRTQLRIFSLFLDSLPFFVSNFVVFLFHCIQLIYKIPVKNI